MKLYKKLSTATLALILAVSGLLGVTMQSVDAFSGSGGGVSGNPYIITTCAQLQEMKDSLAAYYKLGGDIDCDVAPYNTGSGFEPVGSSDTPFTGSLDGNGYTVNGLFIGRGGTDNIGLVGYTDSGSSIVNIGLVDADITGGAYTGSLVGVNSGGTVEGSYAKGSVGGDRNVGGLVGYNTSGGTIKTSYATADVASAGSAGDSGGLVGLNNGTIHDTYATGNVHGANLNVYAGGLVGLASGSSSIKNSYATGDVSVASEGSSFAGGLVGVNGSMGSTTIDNSYATGTASAAEGSEHEGGFIGNNNGTATNSYSVGSSPVGLGPSTGITGGQSLSSFYQTDPLLGVYTGTPPWDFSGGVWHFTNSSSLPVLKMVEPPANSIVVNNAVNGKPVSITTPAGTGITCGSAIKESDTAKHDSGYMYPDGLVKFCFDTNTSNNQVTLIFATSLVPGQVIARKYNSVTQTYAAITDATITATTYSGQPALSVTYTIVDNGPLDENPAVGAITDPVGLAVPNTEVPNTGLPRQSIAPLIIAITAGTLLVLSRAPARRQRTHDIS